MNDYNADFKKLIEQSLRNGQYIGLGNPNSNILFVGKEAGIDSNQDEHAKDHLSNALLWSKGERGWSENDMPKDEKHRNLNHTWQKYQKLYILAKGEPEPAPERKYTISFTKEVFTTELSNGYARKSNDALAKGDFKEALITRKANFWKSDFIKQFQVVVIAALDPRYIQNHLAERQEINDIFGVSFAHERVCASSNQKYWIHYSSDKKNPKLVLHTRQFTNGCSNELMEAVAKEIREFMAENNIKFVKQTNFQNLLKN